MHRINYFINRHPGLFAYQKSASIHPHDRLVEWLILRWLPKWATPNRLTLMRIGATPMVFYIIYKGWYGLGMTAFVLTAFTDVLDGSLARTKNMITNFGIMFDPLADKLLVGSMVLLLVFQHFQLWLGITILGIEIIFIISAFLHRIRFKTVRMANVWGKIKMFMQVLAVFITLCAITFNNPGLFAIATGLFGLAIGFAVISLFSHGI